MSVERFLPKIDFTDSCWLWIGGKVPDGYGMFWRGDKNVPAHRFAYELWVGPIPAGLQLDHLCRTRHCVNFLHLEPVTMRENIMRGMASGVVAVRTNHCKHGHEFTPENIYRRPSNPEIRHCRACRARYIREFFARNPRRAALKSGTSDA